MEEVEREKEKQKQESTIREILTTNSTLIPHIIMRIMRLSEIVVKTKCSQLTYSSEPLKAFHQPRQRCDKLYVD